MGVSSSSPAARRCVYNMQDESGGGKSLFKGLSRSRLCSSARSLSLSLPLSLLLSLPLSLAAW